MTKTIPLSRGLFAIVDDCDFNEMSKFKWCAQEDDHTYYAVRSEKHIGKTKVIRMHRSILNPSDDMVIDHINGNGLDNRRENIRACSIKENCRNYKMPKTNTSGVKGAVFDKRRGKWQVHIKVDRLNKHIGYFDSLEDAAKAYNEAAKKYHGEFAKLNKV
jgi:hypothetical protein